MKIWKKMALISTVALLGVNATACGSSSTNNTNPKQSKENKSIDKDKVKLEKINKQLVEDLNGNKKDAENGVHQFDYATYIEKIEVTSENQAHVYVDESFMNLDDAQKTEVGHHASNLVLRSKATAGFDVKPEDQKQGIYLAFYTGGKKALGHSKLTDYNTYKFY